MVTFSALRHGHVSSPNFLKSPMAGALTLIAFLVLSAPSVVDYGRYQGAWDDFYFFHRAVCMNHAVYDLDWTSFLGCFSSLNKSPILAFMAVPWGPLGGTELGVGLSMVSLALTLWLVVFVTYGVCRKIGLSPLATILGAACIFLNPFITGYGGAFLSDILLSWVVLLTVLLIPLENDAVDFGRRASIYRGLLWALAINIGVLSKVTYGFFIALALPAIVLIRWRKGGLTSVITASVACVIASIPSIMVWGGFGVNFLRHAMNAAWGNAATFYAVEGLGAFQYTEAYAQSIGYSFIPLIALALFSFWQVWAQRRISFVRLLPLIIIAAYFALIAVGENRDLRFGLPVMIALPFALAALPSGRSPEPPTSSLFGMACMLGCVLVSIPMAARPQLNYVRDLNALLTQLVEQKVSRVVVATDSPEVNIESLLLAKHIGGKAFSSLTIYTLAYDFMHNKPLTVSYDLISKSDVVIFQKPIPTVPDFTNKYAKEYLAYTMSLGFVPLARTPSYLTVFGKE